MRDMLKKLVKLFVIFITILVLIELLLRLFMPLTATSGNIDWYEYDEELGVKIKPNLNERGLEGDYQAEIRTNAIGTVNYQEDFKKYKKIIFSAGDSFTQGTGLYSDATYPFQLDIKLNVKQGEYRTEYGVVNLGLASYGLLQSIITIERYSRLISKPDFILFYGYSNDYADDMLFKSGYRHSHLVDNNPKYNKTLLSLMQWSSVNVEIIKRAKIIYSSIRRQKVLASSIIPRDQNSSLASMQEERFDDLLQMSKKLGSKLIVGWANSQTSDDGSYAWLKEWAATHNVGFADWWPKQVSISEGFPTLPLENRHITGHYKTWVNEVIASSFLENIY